MLHQELRVESITSGGVDGYSFERDDHDAANRRLALEVQTLKDAGFQPEERQSEPGEYDLYIMRRESDGAIGVVRKIEAPIPFVITRDRPVSRFGEYSGLLACPQCETIYHTRSIRHISCQRCLNVGHIHRLMSAREFEWSAQNYVHGWAQVTKRQRAKRDRIARKIRMMEYLMGEVNR